MTLRLPQVPDDLTLLALTVYQEAAGEPWAGKLAVASVILTRARQTRASILDTIFRPWQFSAWNTDSPTRMRLDTLHDEAWAESYKAACAAAFGLAPDPSQGADHYLNETVTRANRPTHDLPLWFREDRVTARIGRHTFLKLSD